MHHDNSEALRALAATLEIPLSFNHDGVCDLVLNGNALITLEGDPQDPRCASTLWSALCRA